MYEDIKAHLSNGEYKLAKEKIESFCRKNNINIFEEDKWYDCEKFEGEDIYLLYASVCEALGDSHGELVAIRNGLLRNSRNYELYYMLGIYYEFFNINKAYLCFDMAYRFCEDKDDKKLIFAEKEKCKNDEFFRLKNTSFVILSFNDKDIIQECLKQVRTNMLEGDEIIVVDNASTDGVDNFLKEEKFIKLILNSENVGFSKGCNIGAANASSKNDILFLNNDAIMTPGSYFSMKMSLYDERNIGAVGAVSNNALCQNADLFDFKIKSIDDAVKIGDMISTFGMESTKEMVRLTGFCILLSRNAIDEISFYKEEEYNLFDSFFSPAYFEDDDLGMRLSAAGFRQLLCYNAFVYHVGGEDSGKSFNTKKTNVIEESMEKFKSKWGFDIWNFEAVNEELVGAVCKIVKDKATRFSFLELYTGMGTNLSELKFRYKNAYFAGCEQNKKLAMLGRYMGDIKTCDIEDICKAFPKNSFDIICLHDALLRCDDKELFLTKICSLLKDDGTLISSKDCMSELSKYKKNIVFI